MLAKVYWDHGHLKGVPFGFTIAFLVAWVAIGIFVVSRLWGRWRR
jgi:hypothetical protein